MNIREGLGYEDVLLAPAYSEVLPGEADVSTVILPGINLKVPFLSAAMDTVTEAKMAIALALEGGAGVIHRNLSPQQQADHVRKTKRFLNWIIDSPVTVQKGIKLHQVRKTMVETGVTGLPVLENNKLVGIITKRDLQFHENDAALVETVMTCNPVVITGHPTGNIVKEKFQKHRVEKLPLVDEQMRLTGLVTVSDLEKHRNYPDAVVDDNGRLVVGAAVSPGDWQVRIPLLIDMNVDFIVLDTAHGASADVLDAMIQIKKSWPNIRLIGGNVADGDGAKRVIEAGADAVKVGVGPGSICTTRVVAGIGVPQFSAVVDAVEICDQFNIPVIADGGIKYSGDITKAIGAGASAVMIGNLFAGLKESPGQEIIYEGRFFKTYRGMGSIGAIETGGSDRYRMSKESDPVPEGIEGRVPYKGELSPYLYQLVTGLRKGMGYTGCATLEDLRTYRQFIKITQAGLKESHPHSIHITHEAPNYTR